MNVQSDHNELKHFSMVQNRQTTHEYRFRRRRNPSSTPTIWPNHCSSIHSLHRVTSSFCHPQTYHVSKRRSHHPRIMVIWIWFFFFGFWFAIWSVFFLVLKNGFESIFEISVGSIFHRHTTHAQPVLKIDHSADNIAICLLAGFECMVSNWFEFIVSVTRGRSVCVCLWMFLCAVLLNQSRTRYAFYVKYLPNCDRMSSSLKNDVDSYV